MSVYMREKGQEKEKKEGQGNRGKSEKMYGCGFSVLLLR